MNKQDTELLAKLRRMFKIEAEEHLQAIADGLLALENKAGTEEENSLLETLFREVHTLKGAARAVNLSEIEGICQTVEGICSLLKRKELRVWPELFDILHQAVDMVRQLSEVPGEGGPAGLAELMKTLGRLETQGRAYGGAIAPVSLATEPVIAPSVEPPPPVGLPMQTTDAPLSSPRADHVLYETQIPSEQAILAEMAVARPKNEVIAAEKIPGAEGAEPAVVSSPKTSRRRAAGSRTPTRAGTSVRKERSPLSRTGAVDPRDEVALREARSKATGGSSSLPAVVPAMSVSPGTLPTRERSLRAAAQAVGKSSAPAETVRIATSKLDSLFLQAEEMLAVKLKTSQHAAELRVLVAMLDAWKREWAKIHTEVRKTQRILEKEENRSAPDPIHQQAVKLVEFLDWTNTHLKAVHKELNILTRGVAQDQQSLGSMVDILLEDAKKVLLLPFSSALEVLPTMVRDLSRAQGKDVDLVLQGGEVEIDKRILEEMKDPLIHLLRNCLDHGIEKPTERVQQGKSPRGTISVAVAPTEGNMVEIVIADDGVGIDLLKVKDAAVRSGILSQKAADKLGDQETILLIFQSEVSTSPVISNISGRGLGMAIVREKVEKLGGQISVETQPQRGTTFCIRLPLTLATFRGILVQAGSQLFVIPTASVERAIRVKRDEIRAVENQETIALSGQPVPLIRLDQILGVPRTAGHSASLRYLPALVLSAAEKRFAFSVDAVLSEQEVLFKNLGKQLSRVRNIAGATVLGSGQVVPILNVADLVKSAAGGPVIIDKAAMATVEEGAKRKSVLIAEDSITSRMLLKEILEAAGYAVSTAIDGVDAFAALQKQHFDLVVSDVEMPRMNGFDLTAKIRGDEKHAQVPVVLVTGLESRIDRERGVDVGASAYVVKGSFDQSDLLETIRRLI